ncbi:MAG: DNA internalization-related competence protein ComEC/Rec2 [Bacillota bacterium]
MKRFEEFSQSIKTLCGALAKRPLFVAGICFALGVSLGVAWRPQGWVWLPGIASGGALFYLFRRTYKGVFLLAVALCALCTGGLRIGMDFPANYAWVPEKKADVVLTGRIALVPEKNDRGTVLVLDSAGVQTKGQAVPLNGRVRLQVSGELGKEAVYGRNATTEAKIEVPDGARYPGDFDYRMYLLSRGIQYTATAKAVDMRFSGKAAWHDPMAWGAAIRTGIGSAIESLYPGEVRGVMTGILVGGHADITEQDYRAFQDTGIAHVLSVSGLHVGFVVAGLVAVLSLIRVKKRAQWWITAGFLALYCIVVGFAPSVLRASVMALVLLYGRAIGQRQDGLSSLSLALILVLLITPLDWFTSGLQLSFCATLGIVLLYQPLTRVLHRLPKYIRESLAVCLSAQLGMLPVMVAAFNSLSVVAVLANLLFIPLFGILMAAALISTVLFAIWAPLAMPLAYVSAKLAEGMMLGIRALSGASFAAVKMVSWPVWISVLWTAALWLVSRASGLTARRRVRAVCMLALAVAIGVFISLIIPQPLKIVMLDVGQAECIVIRTPDRRTYLVDCGAPAGTDPYKNSQITEYLLKNGVNTLEGIIISHAHNDHTAELDIVTQVFSSAWVAFTDGNGASMDLHGAKRIGITDPATVIDLGGGVVAQTVSVKGGGGGEASLMFVLKYGEFSMLFTGDAEKQQEIETLRRLDRIDVLKVGHHGSDTSTSRELLTAIQPSAALISVGANAYGLPDEGVLKRLKAQGTAVYRTDTDGCIEIVCHDGAFTVLGLAEPLLRRE